MFIWDESVHGLDVLADNVVHLFRSMRDVQLALPGISGQQASAYLCQYKQPEGISTVAVFHLHKSGILAFYFSEPRIVTEQKMDEVLNQGLNFVESMGFLLTDQDVHLMDQTDVRDMWRSLPLEKGLAEKKSSSEPPQRKASGTVAADKTAADVTEHSSFTAKQQAVAETARISEKVAKHPPAAKPGLDTEPVTPQENKNSENVDDLLAAVEAMRAKSSGLRARMAVPSAEEMKLRKERLRETVGRILATL